MKSHLIIVKPTFSRTKIRALSGSAYRLCLRFDYFFAERALFFKFAFENLGNCHIAFGLKGGIPECVISDRVDAGQIVELG